MSVGSVQAKILRGASASHTGYARQRSRTPPGSSSSNSAFDTRFASIDVDVSSTNPAAGGFRLRVARQASGRCVELCDPSPPPSKALPRELLRRGRMRPPTGRRPRTSRSALATQTPNAEPARQTASASLPSSSKRREVYAITRSKRRTSLSDRLRYRMKSMVPRQKPRGSGVHPMKNTMPVTLSPRRVVSASSSLGT